MIDISIINYDAKTNYLFTEHRIVDNDYFIMRREL